MKTPLANKRQFYSQPRVAATYDSLRFGGASGAWVNERELALMRRLLPSSGRVLDLACGTGRATVDLFRRGYDVVAVDASPEMLRITRDRAPVPAVQGDAFTLPFASGSFDGLVALRLLFHYPDPEPLLREMARLVRPGGSIVVDTYRWTPRSLAALGARRWGGKVFVHPARALRRLASEHGLVGQVAEHCFLVSPYVYRRLPIPLIRALAALEPVVPPGLRSRIFWRFDRV